ncbi:MAG: 2-aminoethylphosphonate--pyruvate transaminase [Micrococcales bacterium]|nr:2-aminoethylphosphonate--pyruvate transaminase [Micrococcales bacterium]
MINEPGHVLLTPGPLTTSDRVRAAATRDFGSWDQDFNDVTAEVRAAIVRAAGGMLGRELTCVPMQGSGTFSVEAMVRTFVPQSGGLLVASNGAYGERMARIAQVAGLRVRVIATPWDQPIDPGQIARELREHPGITHVGLIHCETSTGLLNPLPDIADAVHACGARLLLDAMSTFGALDTLPDHPGVEAAVAASGKCLEGLPGVGFAIARRESLAAADGRCSSLSLDLADQHAYMERTGQWRYTPPTHVVAALREAMLAFEEEGGRAVRLVRYQENSRALADGAASLGLAPYLPDALQAPIIHTFYAPASPRWDFSAFYQEVKARGFILYPGKLTAEDTFRVGCIGQVTPQTMAQACGAIEDALVEIGVRRRGAVAGPTTLAPSRLSIRDRKIPR